MLHRFEKEAKGFTLIELLIVVAIIGILAAIAIPNFLSAATKSKYARALADTKVIVSQAQLYNNDNNTYPADLPTLQAGGTYMSATRDPFATNGTDNYVAVVSAAPVRAHSVGTPANTAAWNGTGAIGATQAGFSSQLGCSVGSTVSSNGYAKC